MATYRQESGTFMMQDIVNEGGFANSTEMNNGLNEILKTLLTASDGYKNNVVDNYELCTRMRMFKLLQDRFFRGVP